MPRAQASEGYANLEYDLEAGERGSRHALVSGLLQRLTGAEDALVVNNNAAAVLLILSALGQGREAIISRGAAGRDRRRLSDSGCACASRGVALVEVGTTNRTYADDYAGAINEHTALLLRVHASNFRIVGFVHQPSTRGTGRGRRQAQPAAGRRPRVGLAAGHGALRPRRREPMVQDSVAAGAALVCFSGDKLLGGPQAGIIVGRAARSSRLQRHPLTRAIRPDKLTLAALGATLVHYVRGEAEREVPVWRMMSASSDALRAAGAQASPPMLDGRASRDALGDRRRLAARADAAELGCRAERPCARCAGRGCGAAPDRRIDAHRRCGPAQSEQTGATALAARPAHRSLPAARILLTERDRAGRQALALTVT